MDTANVFAERLLQVIDEGRRTATYKLALLTALIDASAAHADDAGNAPHQLHTRVVAEHVLRTYFPQARLYLAGDGDPMQLRQITTDRSAVLGAVIALHLLAAEHRLRSISEIARRFPAEYERCIDQIELTFARQPIPRLQVIGRQERPFLYDIDWTSSVSLAALHTDDGGQIRFRSSAGDHLLRLAPLLRPLIELHWTRMVARINRINVEDDRLHSHLFGTERSTFPRTVRSGLADLQDATCFYCHDRLTDRTQIDHFIPWARWPNNAIENLVLTDSCNTHKRDYLPSLAHVDRWAHRLATHHAVLAGIADTCHWESDPKRSLALARSCYAHLPAGTPLWSSTDRFTEDEPARITDRLTALCLE
jgi:hypothetical protein